MKINFLVLVLTFSLFFKVGFANLFLFGRPIDKHGFLIPPKSTKTNVKPIPENWFDQKLDHFDFTNPTTWKQRYFLNFKYVNSSQDSPIFLQLGGEGEANPIWLEEGQISNNYAKHFNALQILLEHRYYGQSYPTKNMSTENLKYLTSEQALQDAATFIGFIKQKYNFYKNKWIVFGGSYSGSLAAWFRLKYPHLVSGAVASSAPINAILNFKDYIKIVDTSLGKQCVEHIRQATENLKELFKKPEGWKEIEQKFSLCEKLDGNNQLDVFNLMSNLAGNFEGIVQYNKDNRKFEGAVATDVTIDSVCSIMMNFGSTKKPIDRYARINQILLNAYSLKCLDFSYKNFLENMQKINFKNNSYSSARLWTYQTCTEFGFFQTSSYSNQPFGDYFPLKFFVKQCVDIFGDQFDENFIEKGINFTNNFYGGFNLSLSNVIFPNGLIDPWHALGVLKPIDETAKPLLIKETAHCADMYPDSNEDPVSLKNAREEIKQQIKFFLKT